MSIPAVEALYRPLISVLFEADRPLHAVEVTDMVAELIGVTPEQRRVTARDSLKPLFSARLERATVLLHRRGLVELTPGGLWALTEQGREAHESEPEDDAVFLPYGDGQDPRDAMLTAVRDIRDEVKLELQRRVSSLSQDSFQKLARLLLTRMYGRTLLWLPPAVHGPQVLTYQCEHYDGPEWTVAVNEWNEDALVWVVEPYQLVSQELAESFARRMRERQLDRGMLFVQYGRDIDIKDFSRREKLQIALFEPDDIAELMLKHGLGVTHDNIQVPRIDSDFFEDEA